VDDDVVICAEGLGKKYAIGHRAEFESYVALRDVLARGAKKLWRNTADLMLGRVQLAGTTEEFWALREVNFEVRRGEVLGIIGRNGAGKSTLLKILSRVTEPSAGRVTIRGRVASLLEVGTGFHPELTGRENVFLNGAILGMTRAEIRRKLDEIVAFAEVERFLDTPVKRFSSGMYLRLAFAVAAHLDPEILVIDEVLAVGDIEFQKKCLDKVKDTVSRSARTVIFVSHNIGAVEGLCPRALLLSHGRRAAYGRTSDVLQRYLTDMNREYATPLSARADREGTGEVRFVSFDAQNGAGASLSAFTSGTEAVLCFEMKNTTSTTFRNMRIEIQIRSQLGQPIILLDTDALDKNINTICPGNMVVKFCIAKMPLVAGRYYFQVFCTLNNAVSDWIRDAGHFEVEAGDIYGTGRVPAPGHSIVVTDFDVEMQRGAELAMAAF
jgi:lipopolysaccharide transport system ATP-binding protein